MAFAADSREPGYLGPSPGPAPEPLVGDPWMDFLHDIFTGATGLDPTLVRPYYQGEPANMPDYGVTWLSFNLNTVVADWDPEIRHHSGGAPGDMPGSPDGYDEFSRVEEIEIALTFYGPECELRFDYLRDGLSIEQNREVMRTREVALVGITKNTQHGELIKNRWVSRLDSTINIRRVVRRHYPILNLLRAQGDVEADTAIDSDFDTANEESKHG
jgi:hypothetical protein